MSIASLVTVPSTCLFPNLSRTGTKSVSSFSQGGGLQESIGESNRSPARIFSHGGPISEVGSSVLKGFRLGGFRDHGGRKVGFGYDCLKRGSNQRTKRSRRNAAVEVCASGIKESFDVTMEAVKGAWAASPPTWEAACISVGSIFVLAAPLLLVGLTKAGIASAYVLGSLIWRAYGGQGLFMIALFYVIGTAATKLKMKQKQKEGIAEKRSGMRGPASVWGSGSAGAICAICSLYGVGGPQISPLWHLGYLASLCTKLSDTISSEIGKAYGKTTYLVTTFSSVPRGTEGAVSVEGTLAGFTAATFLAVAAYSLQQVDKTGALIVVGASQLANLFESILGATLQGKPGYEWLSNDLVNVANITVGAALAMAAKKYVGFL